MTLHVNLLPWRERRLDKRRRFWLTAALLGFTAQALLLLLLVGRAQLQLSADATQLAFLAIRHAALNTQLDKVSALKAEHQRIEAQNLLSQQRFASSLRYVQVLQHLSRAVPQGVWIRQMTQDASELKLEGRGEDYNRVLSLSQSLRTDALLPKVHLREVKQLPAEALSFSLSAVLPAPEK